MPNYCGLGIPGTERTCERDLHHVGPCFSSVSTARDPALSLLGWTEEKLERGVDILSAVPNPREALMHLAEAGVVVPTSAALFEASQQVKEAADRRVETAEREKRMLATELAEWKQIAQNLERSATELREAAVVPRCIREKLTALRLTPMSADAISAGGVVALLEALAGNLREEKAQGQSLRRLIAVQRRQADLLHELIAIYREELSPPQ